MTSDSPVRRGNVIHHFVTVYPPDSNGTLLSNTEIQLITTDELWYLSIPYSYYPKQVSRVYQILEESDIQTASVRNPYPSRGRRLQYRMKGKAHTGESPSIDKLPHTTGKILYHAIAFPHPTAGFWVEGCTFDGACVIYPTV